MYCWDLDATFDSNEDGFSTMIVTGKADFIRSLSAPLGQPLVITANVWDDDMARDNQSFDIIIVNQPPRAIITDAQLGLTVTQNELFSISAANSIDTESDRPRLRLRGTTLQFLEPKMAWEKNISCHLIGRTYTKSF